MSRQKPLMLIVFSLLLGGAIALSVQQETHANEPDLGSEFEPLGPEVGEQGLPRRIRHIPTGIVLVLVPSGQFVMGTPDTESRRDGDEAQRAAVIPSAFYLGETEVTVGQWRQVMGPDTRGLPHQDHDELPACGVSWYQAHAFIDKMNETGEGGWRLPKEIEWEYACRAGTRSPFSFGDSLTTTQANFDGFRPYAGNARGLRRDRPVKVRSFSPNAWGLYEMHGNVFEWCEDLYVAHPERGQLPRDVSGAPRVLRGGAWNSKGAKVRSGFRDGYPPASDGAKYGFRLAKTVIQR